jgi:hypothetical protein
VRNIEKLTFVKKLPAVEKVGRSSKSPLERAKEKFIHEIDLQISLTKDPNFTEEILGKQGKQKGKVIKSRKPRSWVQMDGDTAYITPRFSNKPISLGARKGSHIKVLAKELSETFNIVKAAVEGGELDDVIQKAMDAAKRGKRE